MEAAEAKKANEAATPALEWLGGGLYADIAGAGRDTFAEIAASGSDFCFCAMIPISYDLDISRQRFESEATLKTIKLYEFAQFPGPNVEQ